MMERVRTWWYLCEQCARCHLCERCRKGRKIVTCGEEAPDELCGDFEWTDGR